MGGHGIRGAMKASITLYRCSFLRGAGVALLLAFTLLVPFHIFAKPPISGEAFPREKPSHPEGWEGSYVFPFSQDDVHVWDKSFPLTEVLRKISSPDFELGAPLGRMGSSGAFYLPFNEYVKTYINSRNWRAAFRSGYKRSGLYERIIMDEINRRGLPEELIYLCMIESMFRPRAVSPANAKGLWQFIYSTGCRYDLTINYWIDERYDPVKSTRAAMDYLSDLYNIFGDWHLAAAAYNCGEDRVARKLRQNGCDDYWCLVKKDALPYETKHYVPRIVAMAIFGSNPERYGFYNLKKYPPYNYSTVTVDDATDLGLIAELTGVSKKRIKELNPEIIRFCTPPGTRRYRVKVPWGKAESFNRKYARLSPDKRYAFKKHRVQKGQSLRLIASGYRTSYKLLASINGLSTRASLREGQHLVIPVPQNRKFDPAPPPSPKEKLRRRSHKTAPKGKKKHIYIVEPGDTMWTIAKANGVSIDDLKEWNPDLTADNLYYGDKIAIYSREKPKAPPKAPRRTRLKGPTRKFTYTVREGDRCYYMARHYGITSQDIIEKNDLDENCSIRLGQDLVMVVPEKAPESLPPTADEAPPPKPRGDFSLPAPSLPKTKPKAKQPEGTRKVSYMVEEGDCLWLIARNHDCHIEEVLDWNGLGEDYAPRPGQELTLYVDPDWKPPQKKKPEDQKQRTTRLTVKKKTTSSKGSRGPAINYKVKPGDNLWMVARNHDVHMKEIREWNDLESDTLHQGQVLTIKPGPGYEPGSSKTSSASKNSSNNGPKKSTAARGSNGSRKVSYKVKPGDSLWGIARYHDVHVADILSWNNMDKDKAVIRPGDTLTIYVSKKWSPPKNITPDSPTKDSKKSTSESSSPKSKKDIGKRGKAITYVVQEGDSLWGIARKHDVHMWEIKKLNNMDSDAVRPGQKLKIKPGPGHEQ